MQDAIAKNQTQQQQKNPKNKPCKDLYTSKQVNKI